MRRDEFPIVEEYCKDKIVAELEKIKDELISEIDFDVEKMRFYINEEDLNRVFIKHISELKGE